MKKSQNTPAFMGSLTKRFPTLTRPLFWGSLGTIMLGTLALYQYWQNPQWLQTETESPTQTNIGTNSNLQRSDVSPDELAAAANIDNIDLLLKEIDQNRTLAGIAQQNRAKQAAKVSQPQKEESQFSRLQQEQKKRLTNPTSSLNSSESNTNPYTAAQFATSGNTIQDLLQPPSLKFRRNQPNSSGSLSQTASNNQNEIIPNPVGNSYLRDRNQARPLTNSRLKVAPSGLSTPANPNSNSPGINPEGSIPEENNSSGAVTPNLLQPSRFVPGNAFGSTNNAPATNQTPNPGISNLGTNTNPINSYSNIYSRPYSPNGVANPNPTSGSPNTVTNGINGVVLNGVDSPSSTQTAQPNTGLNNGFNNSLSPIRRENSSLGSSNQTTNSLQDNFRSYRQLGASSGNLAPNPYQLQPGSFGQSGAEQNQNINGVINGSVNPSIPFNNLPITRPTSTPALQPSGTLRTGEWQP